MKKVRKSKSHCTFVIHSFFVTSFVFISRHEQIMKPVGKPSFLRWTYFLESSFVIDKWVPVNYNISVNIGQLFAAAFSLVKLIVPLNCSKGNAFIVVSLMLVGNSFVTTRIDRNEQIMSNGPTNSYFFFWQPQRNQNKIHLIKLLFVILSCFFLSRFIKENTRLVCVCV